MNASSSGRGPDGRFSPTCSNATPSSRCGRDDPEAASAAASQGSELAASNTYSEFTVGAIALSIVEADRAAGARVRRDDAAVGAARERARRFRDIARPMAGDHAAQLATIDAELARDGVLIPRRASTPPPSGMPAARRSSNA